MRTEDRDGVTPTLPALVVTYGHTSKKCRPLDADVIVLGRAPSCDFSLVSPEVAPVHCILVRSTDGWRLRDCSGRPGTRVNGKVIQETRLDDGDVIQVGSFSFQTHLPDQAPAAAPVSPTYVAHLEKSRRNLVRLALKLRKHLGDRARAIEDVDSRLIAQRREVAQQVEVLKARQREFELRMTRLELSERDLATDRATLDRQYRDFQNEVSHHAAAVQLFEEQRQALDAEIHLLRQQAATRPADDRLDSRAELILEAEAAIGKHQTQFERLVAEMRQILDESREEQQRLAERLRKEIEQPQVSARG
jgi:pSer/pThr/pTyr-binding forkhead associated (FHA) protein